MSLLPDEVIRRPSTSGSVTRHLITANARRTTWLVLVFVGFALYTDCLAAGTIGADTVATAQFQDFEHAVVAPVHGRAPGMQEVPRVAANATGALVVWADGRGNGDVYGTRLDVTGRVVDPVGFRIAQGFTSADVAAVGDDYMVALSRPCDFIEVVGVTSEGITTQPRRIGDSSPFCAGDISIASNGTLSIVAWRPGRAVLIDRDGDVLTNFTFPSNAEFTAVASNGKDFLLVGLLQNGRSLDLSVAFVSRTGELGNWTVLQTLSAVTQTSGLAAASDGTDYLVATTGLELRTQIIRADGSVASPPKIHSSECHAPQATWAGDNYLLSFVRTHDISLARIDLNGSIASISERVEPVHQNFTTPNLDISWSPQLGPYMAWGFEGEVFGSRISENATVADSLLSVAAGHQSHAQIAAVSDGFVVVWREYSPEQGFTLKVRTLNDDLSPRGEILHVARVNPGSGLRVVASGSGVVLSWTDNWGSGTLYVQRYFHDLRPIDREPVVIATKVRQYSIAASQHQALIVWTAPGTADYSFQDDVYASLIQSDAASVPSARITIAEQLYDDHAPAAAWSGSEFLVVWAHALHEAPQQGHWPDPPDELLAVRVSSAGAPRDLTPLKFFSSNPAITAVSVASTGHDYFILWRTNVGRIEGTGLDEDLNLSSADLKLLSPPDVNANDPFVVSAGNGYVLTWDVWLSTYLHQIQMRRAFRNVLSSSVEFPSRETSYAGGAPAIAATRSGVVVAYDRLAFEPEVGGSSRVFVRGVLLNQRRRPTSR